MRDTRDDQPPMTAEPTRREAVADAIQAEFNRAIAIDTERLFAEDALRLADAALDALAPPAERGSTEEERAALVFAADVLRGKHLTATQNNQPATAEQLAWVTDQLRAMAERSGGSDGT